MVNLRIRPRWTFLWTVVALVALAIAGGRSVPLAAAGREWYAAEQPLDLPDAPRLLAPSDGSRTCDRVPTFSWRRDWDATLYRIQIDDDAKFGSPLVDRTTDQTYFQPGSQLPAGTWHWRVRGANETITGQWSAPWSVTILVRPATPALLSPSDGSLSCDGLPLLEWSAVDQATFYRVQVDDDAAFGSPALDQTTETPSDALEKALSPGTYFWRVQAANECGESAWSAVYSFVVPLLPAAPLLLAPPDGSSTQDRTPTLSWESAGGAFSYTVQVDDSPTFATPLVDEACTESWYVPASLLSNGTYYWRVQAVSVCGGGEWSDPWRLTVYDRAPVALDDQYSVDEDSPDRALDVLANDRDPDGDPLHILDVTQPLSGSVSIAAGGTYLIYRPDPDFYGLDSLTYTAGDPYGDTDTARVELIVTEINDSPVADAGPDQSVPISATVRLDGSRSHDPEGDLPLSYFWTQSGGPPVALSSGVVASPTFVAPAEPCTLTFQLFVIDARGKPNAAPDQTVVTVFKPVIHYTYLPSMIRAYVYAPDLVVQQIDASSTGVRVVIANQGSKPVRAEFFVDLYLNPRAAPQRVNQTWDQLGDRGAVWGVTAPALSALVPGGSVTLEVGDRYYLPELSSFGGTLPAGTIVYAQVDSFNPGTAYGTVLEGHEIGGGAYNNVYGPVASTK